MPRAPTSTDVAAFLTELKAARDDVRSAGLVNSKPAHTASLDALRSLQRRAQGEFHTQVRDIRAAPAGPARDQVARDAIRMLWRISGRHADAVRRLDDSPFQVRPDRPDGKNTVDIRIEVRDLPIPAAIGQLKADIDHAANVIRTVMADRLRSSGIFNTYSSAETIAAQTDYMDQLVGLARVGLEIVDPSRVKFARADLDRLTAQFTLREAGTIKNAYVNTLAVWCGLAAFVFAGLYWMARKRMACEWLDCGLIYDFRNFHLLAAGTAMGTWLSFSLRRQELDFGDLAVLEPDRLTPPVRVVFMIGLASLVGLLLFTGAVVAGIGSVTGQAALRGHGTWALLIGLLAGVAERTLGNAVSQRSRDFTAGIGASVKPARAPAASV